MSPRLLTLLAILTTPALAGPLWTEDFESVPSSSPADSPLKSASGITWTSNMPTQQGHRIYQSPNFKKSSMWISKTDGATLTSSGTRITSNTHYSFSFCCAIDTRILGCEGTATAEILIGPTIKMAKVVESLDFKVEGKVKGKPFNKAVNVRSISTTTGKLKDDNQIFIRFTRNPIRNKQWLALDDISLTSSPKKPNQIADNKKQPNSGATLLAIGNISIQLQ